MSGTNFRPSGGSAIRPDLLYLAHRVPYPPDKGDRIRTYHLIRAIAEVAEVHLACFADEPPRRSDLEELRRLCRRVAVVPVQPWMQRLRAIGSLAVGGTASEGAFASSAMRRLIEDWTSRTRFRSAVVSASSLAYYLRLPATDPIHSVVDLVDLDSQKWLDYAAADRGARAWIYRLEGRRLGLVERAIPHWAKGVTLVSEPEADLFRRSGGSGPIHAVTNGVDLDYFKPDPEATEIIGRCVFVGALDYRPNVDGIAWFCREAWPSILGRRPEARLALVGRKPSAELTSLAGRPGLELVGQVGDVRPQVGAASVVLVPLRIARGIQNKVLEALAMGKAVVASPEAIEGIRVEPGVHLVVASSPAEWIEAVTRLLEDPAERRRLGAGGRLFVEQSHDWSRCLAPFLKLLNLGQCEPSDPVDFEPVGQKEGWE